MLSCRRGISHIISVVLVTVMTLSLAVPVLMWSTNLISGYQSSYGNIFSRNIDKLQESFIVEDVWFVAQNNITVYVKNVGEVTIKVVNVYVDNTPRTTSPTTKIININGHDKLCVTDKSWISGETYVITIVTERGNSLSSYWEA